MSKTVVGLFDDATSGRVASELESAGFSRGSIHRHEKGESARRELESLGVPPSEAGAYESELARGLTAISVETRDEDSEKAAQIMRGEARGAETARPGRRAGARTKDRELEGEEVIPVVEEEIEIGKREIGGGGVHVFTRVHEVPVEEQVKLREERVKVERVPVDRPASDRDFAAAASAGDLELRERAERAVVGKSAHVVEEVHVGKEVEERTETVRDTVRKTDVEVEELGGRGSGSMLRDHRAHFDRTYGSQSGATWEGYEPAYRMGHELGGDRRYGGRDWSAVEGDARARWERDNPGTWERVKGAVRHAFDRARGGSASARHA